MSERCIFSVNVTAINTGTKRNQTGPVTSTEGGDGNMATARVTVNGCPKKDNPYLFTGTTTAGGTIFGIFCVNRFGMATYQQGTVSGSGGLNINGSSNAFVVFGPNLNLAGGTSGPTSSFTEVQPINAQGTYTLHAPEAA